MNAEIVKYRLAVKSGYKFNLARIGTQSYDEAAMVYKANFPDILITRPNTETDLELLDRKALMTVNGYVHNTVVDNGKLYIKNGSETVLKTGENHVGILSFNGLQEDLTKTAITADMLSTDHPLPMFSKTIITFDHEVGNCFLVIAGYIIFEQPEFFYRVSDRSFALRLDRLSMVEKLYELSRYRNIFEDLSIPGSPINPCVTDVEGMTGDETITNLLTTHNSFLVEVPCEKLNVRPIYLEHSNVPGNFRTQLEPSLPFVGGHGKFCEYSSQRTSDSKYTVYVTDGYYNNHLFTKLSREHIDLYNSARVVGSSYGLSPGFFLEIKCE